MVEEGKEGPQSTFAIYLAEGDKLFIEGYYEKALCERYAFAGSRPSGVSNNYTSRLADLSRPSGSSSTYKYLQFIRLKLKFKLYWSKLSQ